MNTIVQSWQNAAPQLRSVLRIIAAFMFMQAGTMKLFAWPMGMPPNGGTADLMTQVGIGGILEVLGGFMLLIGIWTRPVAFILAGQMAVAYWQFHHSPTAIWPMLNGGQAAVLYCFIFLYLSAAGPGPWSLDHALRRRSKTP